MIVDCHFHFDETMLSLDRMVAAMDNNNINKTALIPRVNETMFTPASLLHSSIHHLFRLTLLNFQPLGILMYKTIVTNGHFNYSGSKFKIFANPDNSAVAHAISQFPDRFLGWVMINPLLPNAISEMRAFLAKPGFIGVKAHPFMHCYSIRALDEAAAICQELGKPMLIHLSAEPESFKYLPMRYPKLKIIYAHAGIPFWKRLWAFARQNKNIYVDLSSDYLSPYIAAKAVKYLGYRQCLYGSDGPYGMRKYNEYDYSEKKRWVEALPVSEREKRYILGENFMGLIS